MKKKVLSIFIAIIALGSTVMGQEREENMRYVFEDGVDISGFGGATVAFGQINDEFAVITGGAGAMLINQRFYIGGFGEGLSTQHKRDQVSVEGDEYNNVYTSFGYGGLWTGYIFQPNNIIHLQANVKIGGGAISLTDSFEDLYDDLYDDVVFVAIPAIGAELNVLPWLRIGVDVGYRHVGSVDSTKDDLTGVSVFRASDFNGMQSTVSFMFGGFN